ncbi:MAG: DUF5312 domain-containing protein [Spirochaetia bacterium]|nr:DUF5312 domain-containing protein [Spirochaetia bacterium]
MTYQDDELSNFDRMVSGISDEERQIMLSKMKKTSKKEPAAASKRETESLKEILSVRFHQESFLIRLWIKLKSAFLNIPVEDVYNSSMIARIAHDIERNFPGLIDYRHGVLLNEFFERTNQLINVQDFFLNYIDSYNSSQGSFYITLCNVIIPEYTDKINASCDPYQFPFTKNISTETRVSLIQKLDAAVDAIPKDKRAVMYSMVRCIQWLSAFCHLPLEQLVSNFTKNSESKECVFSLARSDFSDFSKVLNSCNFPNEECLKALFDFNEQILAGRNIEHADSDFASYMANSINQLNVVSTFCATVPVNELAKVVYDNSLYECGIFGNGEDWFVKLKNQWKANFDQKWNCYLADYKKHRLKIKMRSYFETSELPVFPYRPWTRLWSGIKFKYELTLGFLYFFFKREIQKHYDVLNAVMLEGDFSIKENLKEYTDGMNFISVGNENLDFLCQLLTEGGEYGAFFKKCEEAQLKKRSIAEKTNLIIDEIEKQTLALVDTAGKVCRIFINTLGAIVAGNVNNYYGTLNNLSKIKGRENNSFREKLIKAYAAIEHSYEILQEIEGLDESSR